jgi:hypothetical protein
LKSRWGPSNVRFAVEDTAKENDDSDSDSSDNSI